jgi:hypothetical protein
MNTDSEIASAFSPSNPWQSANLHHGWNQQGVVFISGRLYTVTNLGWINKSTS